MDGFQTAKWLHAHLNGTSLDIGERISTLDVYLDVETPAVPDWTLIHKPYLEAAVALIFIATPGGVAPLSNSDWVHLELAWWLKNRKVPPTVIDATGEGDRWIPSSILRRWPNIQRLEFIYNRWAVLAEPQRTDEQRRIVRLLRKSFTDTTPKAVLEQAKRVKSLSRKAWTMAILSLVFLCSTVATGVFLRYRNASLAEITRKQKQELFALNLIVNEVKRPTIVIISETDGQSFEAGKAELAPTFKANLDTKIIPYLENVSTSYGVDTIEIIGHTDNIRLAGRISNFDVISPSLMSDFTSVIPSSNVELGMLRALAVGKILETRRSVGGLKAIRFIRCYSAGSFIPSGSEATAEDYDPERRRIEIRLFKRPRL